METVKAAVCPYCGNQAELLRNSAELYHGHDFGAVWICRNDDAWVGTHAKSAFVPLGRLANKDLRIAKVKAHAAFDPLWKGKMHRDKCSKHHARNAAYIWLSKQLGIPRELTHIGMMDIEQCQMVTDFCNAVRKRHGELKYGERS